MGKLRGTLWSVWPTKHKSHLFWGVWQSVSVTTECCYTPPTVYAPRLSVVICNLLLAWTVKGFIVACNAILSACFKWSIARVVKLPPVFAGSLGCEAQGYDVNVALPCLRRLVAGFLQRRSGFAAGSVHVVFVADKVAPGQVFSGVLQYSNADISPLQLQRINSLVSSRGWTKCPLWAQFHRDIVSTRRNY